MDAADRCAGIFVGRGGDGAGVQNDEFGFRSARRTLESAIFELPLDGRTVGLGRAATEILDVKAGHTSIVP